MRERRRPEQVYGRREDDADELRCRLVMGWACGNRHGGATGGLEQEEEWLEELAELETGEYPGRALGEPVSPCAKDIVQRRRGRDG